MTIVRPPFVLDFADARLDEPAADFSEEVLAQWEEDRAEIFGEKWTEVKRILAELEMLGIYWAILIHVTFPLPHGHSKSGSDIKLTHYLKMIDILFNSFTCDAVPGLSGISWI
jgi:hypothetical protein